MKFPKVVLHALKTKVVLNAQPYDFGFDVSPLQATWMIFGDILSVHEVWILARSLDGVWFS